MPIRTVIFDLGKTLVPFDLQRLRLPVGEGGAEARALASQFEVGRLSIDQFQRAIQLPPHAAAFDPWWNSIFDEEWLIPPDWIRTLRPRYRLGILSNTNAAHYAWLRPRLPQLGGFDFEILSFEVGAIKPEAAIYAAAEKAAGCPPTEIAYFDDVPAFVEAAQARGWRAERFQDWDALRASGLYAELSSP